MKKIATLTVIVMTIIMCASCSDRESDQSNNSLKVSKEILKAEKKIYDEAVEKIISAEKISKMEMSCSNQGDRYILETTNTEIIDKWVDLVSSFKTTAVPFNPKTGAGYSLYFYVDDLRIGIGGGFVGGNIYIKGENQMDVMITIDNIADLRDKFDELHTLMGFPKED